MPVYEYRCQQCKSPFEVYLKTFDETGVSCPECQSLEIEKQITAPGHVGIKPDSVDGTTCCGRVERCASPGCVTGGASRKRKNTVPFWGSPPSTTPLRIMR